jgi:hypothetical protein
MLSTCLSLLQRRDLGKHILCQARAAKERYSEPRIFIPDRHERSADLKPKSELARILIEQTA